MSDVITSEIIRNAFLAAAEDMRSTLWRSAFSPVIYEMKDCSVALFDERARLLAQAPGLPFFLGALSEVVQLAINHVGSGNIHSGDAYIVNDSYLTGSHLNDVDILTPVIYSANVIGFAITRAHWRDMGGKDAAYSMDSTEIFHEGLRLGVTKLAVRGKVSEDLVNILASNSRLPNSLLGDMHAQIAACRIGERRYREIVERFGLDMVRASMANVFETTEVLERNAISEIPDGTYVAQGFQDNDFHTEDPIPISVRVKVNGTEIYVDTRGSSMQRAGCTNCGLIQTISAIRLAYKFLVRPDLEVTGGSFRSLETEVEPGSIFDASEPAACLQYGTHTMLLVDLIIRALSDAIPERVTAGLPGDAWNVIMTSRDLRGHVKAAWGESTAGGWGANALTDGESAIIHSAAGDFRNFPIESMENKYPVRIHTYGLGIDSGGAGCQRGGLNIVKTYEVLSDGVDVSFWFERTHTPAWGLFGGHDGAVPKVVLEPQSDYPEEVLKVNHKKMFRGMIFTIASGGGGGYGLPYHRPVELVEEDLVDGYISKQASESIYLVRSVSGTIKVDKEETAELRQSVMIPEEKQE